jgi:hypothetical protein
MYDGSTSRYELIPFSASEITGVYLGRDMGEAEREALLTVVAAQVPHAEVWQAVAAAHSDRIEFIRIR